jgi:hypothetical protein
MTIRARFQTSMRLAALLVVAAIVIAAPYGIASAIRSGVCIAAAKAVGHAAEGYALRRLDA